MRTVDEQNLDLVVDSSARFSELLWFPVSPAKLAVLSIYTFGAYELYWFYKNWRLVKEREHSDIMPFWRAFFGFFFCYALFKRIAKSAEDANLPSFSAGGLTAGWIIVTLLWRLPDAYWLLSSFAFLFFMPVQQTVNKLNARRVPGYDPNSRFKGWGLVAVIGLGILFAFAIIGNVLPSEKNVPPRRQTRSRH